MRIDLPDVSVLVALHDVKYIGHEKSHDWLTQSGSLGWATCPLTENGFVRVFTQRQYPNNLTGVSATLSLLETLIQNYESMHRFWADEISLRDRSLFNPPIIKGHKQITDVYLLGLCQKYGGTFVTLDTGVTTASIVKSHSELLRIL